MKMKAKFRVDSHDTDLNGIASAGAIMRYMQETANLQHVRYGPTMEELRQAGKAFILSRVCLDIPGILYPQDVIEVTSWLCEAKGYGYTRNTVLTRGSETIASMHAFWGVMDIESRHPIRVEEIALGFDTENEALTVQAPMRFRLPKEMPLLDERFVVYTDCDENCHINNTRYPGIFCSALDDMRGRRVTGLSLNYMNEARLGKLFSITGQRDEDGAYLFRILLEDGRIGTEGRLLLAPIAAV
ncbi:MAG: hypothetical protein E7618_06360 [Ruminococcaceae bacterium]|nr:hypothetical protein [Oscillospiraceae bacterium]